MQYTLSDFSSGDQRHCPICSDGPDKGEYDHRDLDYLRHLANDHGLMQKEALEYVTCSSRTTLRKWMNKAGVDYRYKYEIPEDQLREWYCEQRLTVGEVAEKVGCSILAVRNRLENYGIEIRGPGMDLLENPEEADLRYRDEDYLRQKYHTDGLSKAKIAEECSVSRGTVQRWLNRHGIESRSLSEAHTLRYERVERSYHDHDLLRELYVEEQMTQREIAEYFGVTITPIQRQMDQMDVDLRYAGAHGRTYETERGEYVRSSHERQIADWLYENGIDYQYEPNLDAKMVPDFLVGGVFVEYWGMLNREDYRERMEEKQAMYETMDVELLNLYPDDLDSLADALSRFR